ncbi:hypothetical protein EDC04DRAFT_2908239 [Pisolithus marmoratus]|nr:hypothetical protein EDC04DRAFT_2908239 [Pisolithus marmoratus]
MPWTSSGSLTSDRIPARQPTTALVKQQAKGKSQPGPPKSKVVSALETRLHNVEYASGKEKDPKGGCFCLAREHGLSTYVPLCYGCGLVLCNLNLPHYACPHCGESFLDNTRRSALVAQILEELRGQGAKEEEERNRAIEEARKAEGAFPLLPSASGTQGARRLIPELYNEEEITVSSYTNTPISSRPPSPAPEEPRRFPPPPREISYVKQPPDPEHPWKNIQFPDLQYIPPPKDLNTHSRQQRERDGGH